MAAHLRRLGRILDKDYRPLAVPSLREHDHVHRLHLFWGALQRLDPLGTGPTILRRLDGRIERFAKHSLRESATPRGAGGSAV
jgi:hypothetical protein